MPSIIPTTRRGQVRPYASVPRIDWSHPLAKGLQFYFLGLNNSYFDVVQNQLGKVNSFGANITSESYPFGRSLKFKGAVGDNWIYAPVSNGAKVAATAPWSSAFASYFKGSLQLNTAIACTADTGATGDTGIAFFSEATGNKVRHYWNNGASSTDFNTSISTNTFQTWLISASSATAAALYVNGALDQNVTPASTTFNCPAPAIVLDNGAANTSAVSEGGANGFIPYFCAWNRTLTASEAFLLHNDPYCFLIFPEDEDFLVGVIAGDTFANTGRIFFI